MALMTSYEERRKVDGWQSVRREGRIVSLVAAGGGYGKNSMMPRQFLTF